MKLKSILLLLLLPALMLLLGGCGGGLSEADIEATVEARVKERLAAIPTPTARVVEKEVVKEVIVEKIVEVVVTATPTPTPLIPPTATPSPTPTPSPTLTPTPTPPPLGSSSVNPMPAGRTVLTDDGLGITVMSVDTDAWPEVKAERSWNDPPKAGHRFLMVKIEIENISGASGQIRVTDSKLSVSGSYSIFYGSDCGLVPEELDVTLSKGQKMSGNVCFEVGDDETDFILNYDTHWLSLGSDADKPD